ncbi:MAG TPA: hypothetical protein VHK01_14210 [Lacipirellulaceae bacterium]|jgi:hypothetical protein|nr:hypothetical protein [Lacipirellulaceae bacterium]
MAFSVKQLLFSMAVVAFGVAALVNADKPFVFQLFDLLTLAILIAIAYGAWINQGAQRAYRIGFLCWAALYYWFFKEGFNIGAGDLIDYAARVFGPERPSGGYGRDRGYGGYSGYGMQSGDLFDWQAAPGNYHWYIGFRSIGHSLLVLFFGLVGGWLTVYFYRKRERRMRITISTASDDRDQ